MPASELATKAANDNLTLFPVPRESAVHRLCSIVFSPEPQTACITVFAFLFECLDAVFHIRPDLVKLGDLPLAASLDTSLRPTVVV
jgi:hypothetical protein